MMKLILFLLSTFTLQTFAQSFMESELLQEKERLAKQVIDYQGYAKTNLERLERERSKLLDSTTKLETLENYEKNFGDARAFTLADLHNKIDSLPLTKKVGKTGKFYKCLKESLDEKNYLNQKYCQTRFNPRLSDEEKEDLKIWNDKTGTPLSDVSRQKENLPNNIERSREYLVTLEKNYKSSLDHVSDLQNLLKISEVKISETKLLPQNKHFLNCNAETPVINLEEEVPFPNATIKGPFFGVPRDNQDGLGTCYANAAKNLLVGVSKGENVASFLDLALHYKNSNGSLSEDGLDAGSSCATLNSIKDKGYCPQEYSPLETGERNHAGEG